MEEDTKLVLVPTSLFSCLTTIFVKTKTILTPTFKH